MKGIIAVHKPVGITSHDVIHRLRKITGIKKIGHAGTLDPLASGILVVAIGREYTKTIERYMKQQKEYVADLLFGYFSETDDAEGEKHLCQGYAIPTKKNLEDQLNLFVGDIFLQPPLYSAIKLKGTPAYKLARKGETPELEPRKSHIDAIELVDFTWPSATIRLVTGSGVYVRSIARTLGERLGCGAYLTGLVRTRVGEFTIKNTQTLEELEKKW